MNLRALTTPIAPIPLGHGRPVTARQLADMERLDIAAASQRLRREWKRGQLRRVRVRDGGRVEYAYVAA
jgi:DNA-binding MarR family transcriptional regulator